MLPAGCLALLRFEYPGYLSLLSLVAALVFFSFRSLAGLGMMRRWLAITARCAVVACMVLALAGAQRTREHDRLAVIFALDRSHSIPQDVQQSQFEFIKKARDGLRVDDQLAVIAFDGESAIEQLPTGTLVIDRISSPIAPDQTNIAASLRMAMALFPAEMARRLVLLSDGNENSGRLLEEADWFKANGVPVDVLPAKYNFPREVIFDRLSAPAVAKSDETVNLRMVLRSERTDGKPITGRVILYHNDQLIDLDPRSPQAGFPVTLEPGLNPLTIPVPLRVSGAHRFRAEFKPDSSDDDAISNNNVGQAFTIVSGQGPILILTTEDAANLQSARLLAAALEREKLACTIQSAGAEPLDPFHLIEYSLVILSNVPANLVKEEEQAALMSYVRDVGGGLIMIGGDESFGAGGWMGSPIEEIMPVAFDVKSKKQIPKGALAMVMHACEIPKGNYWGERVAVAAVKTLSSRDLIGVLSYQWESGGWVVPLQDVGDKRSVVQKIMAMQMGDMPDFDPPMRQAVDALAARHDAAAKHMIVISDFDPQPPRQDVIDKMVLHKITCSTVAIGYGGHMIDENKAQWIAKTTGGKFYRTNDYSQLPQIFIKEATIVRRSMISENAFRPILQNTLPQTVAGITPDEVPQLYGYVVATIKPLAETPMVNRTQDGIDPVLAHWQVGLGRAVAFTSGMWPRWGADWTQWPKFSKLWAQIARWASRQTEESAFDVSTTVHGGKGKIRIDALDKNAAAIDFLRIAGTLVSPAPKYESRPLQLTQIGPGRYEAEFDVRDPGNYLVTLAYQEATGAKSASGRPLSGQIQTGLSIPYSPEYAELSSNTPLLSELAARTGGRVLTPADARTVFDRASLPRAESRTAMWEDLVRWMLILFLIDVAVRRIAISPIELVRNLRSRIAEMGGRMRPAAATADAMNSLKATRSRVRDEVTGAGASAPGATDAGTRRSEAGTPPSRSAKYESAKTDRQVTEDLSKALGGATEQDAPVVSRPTRKPTPTTEADYTSRLLKAKKRAREDMNKADGDDAPK